MSQDLNAVTAAAVWILLRFASAIRRTARGLGPTEGEVRAALIHYRQRDEAEQRQMRPNLTALAGALIAEPVRPKSAA